MTGLTALLLVSLAGASVSSSARHGGAHGCLPSGAKTVLAGKQGRIYEYGRGLYRGKRKLWACLFANRATVALTNVAWFPSPAIAWAGPVVGFARTDVELSDTEIIVADLSQLPITAGPFVSVGFQDERTKVGSLRITRAGAVAWIKCQARGRYSEPETFDRPIYGWGDPRPNCTRPGRSLNSVYKHDSVDGGGDSHLLDRGRGIDPRSLRLRGSTLTWRNDGKRRTAMLE